MNKAFEALQWVNFWLLALAFVAEVLKFSAVLIVAGVLWVVTLIGIGLMEEQLTRRSRQRRDRQ